MNYLVLCNYDSMVKSDALVITKDDMYHLSGAEKYSLMNSNHFWFDMDKAKEYVEILRLTPCTIIDCIDGDIDVNIVSC